MDRRPLSASDLKLSFETVTWGGESYVGFPIIRWPGGAIVELAAVYFGFSLQERVSVGVSSLRPEAYALREWIAFVLNQGRRLDRPDDTLMGSWRESHAPLVERKAIHPHQVERKLSIVYTFYRTLQTALPFDGYGRRRPLLVAPKKGQRGFPITTGIGKDRFGKETSVWGRARAVEPKNTRRPTPNEDAVARILSWIRSAPDRSERLSDSSMRRLILASERDWLVARTKCESGFRAKEATTFTIENVYDTLVDENIFRAASYRDLLTPSPVQKAQIETGLDKIEATRKYLYVRIEGKGSKARYAAMSVSLFRDILTIGLWQVRKQQIDWLDLRDANHADEVFLSFATGEALKSNSVTNILKAAFNALGISGSGHRLRAHYCTFMAISLWEEAMGMNGFVYSQALETTVLHRLAEAMGHKHVTTTVRYYLDFAQQRAFGFKNQKKFRAFRALYAEFNSSFEGLAPKDISLVLGMIGALAHAPDDRLQQVLQLALENEELNPTGYKENTVRKPTHLKLV